MDLIFSVRSQNGTQGPTFEFVSRLELVGSSSEEWASNWHSVTSNKI